MGECKELTSNYEIVALFKDVDIYNENKACNAN
jgi:hypothetical protein